MNVYLAGGMKSGWQEEILNNISYTDSFEFFNPAENNCKKPEEYTAWDLFHVRKCDILFGYMEASNPSGYGLGAEVAYAKALGKTVILVDERSAKDPAFARNYAFIHKIADIVFPSLSEGLYYLSKFK